MTALAGKMDLVIGGASGIGLATARRFAAEGAFVTITGRRDGDLSEAGDPTGDTVKAIRADADDSTQSRAAIDTVRAENGRIDILVINAGIVEPGGIDGVDGTQVAATALFLTDNERSFVVGAELCVDGDMA